MKVCGSKERLAADNGRKYRFSAFVFNGCAVAWIHWDFNALAVELIVDDGTGVYPSCADGFRTRFDDEKIFYGPACVETK